MEKQKDIGLIILAAGASLRMGTPKQLLKFEGETLLRRIGRAALSSNSGEAVVVLGANPTGLSEELSGLRLEIIQNPYWRDGMSSSIRAGLERLLEINGRLRAVLITVCDQPFVSPEIIDGLIGRYLETGALIVASEYGQTRAVPALFDRRLFARLRKLQSIGGAQKLLEEFSEETSAVPFPEGEIDIDTPEDYAGLRKTGEGDA